MSGHHHHRPQGPPPDAVPVATAQNNAPQEIKNVVSFLRGKNGPKVRRGVLNGKRVDYFKGKTAVKALLSPQYKKLGAKKVPKVETEEEAEQLLGRMLPHAFFLRTDRPDPTPSAVPGQPKPLLMSPTQSFSRDAYYTWFTPSSPLSTILGGVAMIIVMLAGVMFPLWPPKLRLGVYYLSIGVLGLIGVFIAIAIVRLILWMVTSLVLRKGIWWFPNLFEDVGFVDSFIPFWAWDEPPPKKGKKSKSGDKTSSKSSKSSGGDKVKRGGPLLDAINDGVTPEGSNAGDGDGDSDAAAPPLGVAGTDRPGEGASTSAAMEGGGDANMRKRQQAYVEDAGDDE